MNTFAVQAGHLVGSNGHIVVIFDGQTGGIRSLENAITKQIAVASDNPIPWRLTVPNASWDAFPSPLPPWFVGGQIAPKEFSFELAADGETALLAWTTSEPGVEVTVRACFSDDQLELWPHVGVTDGVSPPNDLVYPILSGLQPLSAAGADDEVVFPAHSGFLVRRPLEQPRWDVPYPDGYHGCSMQFTAYLQCDVGGFYLATHDPHSTWKNLRFGPDEWSIRHHTWDLRPGTDVEFGYPVVVAALTRGDWFEVTTRYRTWALTAPWCAADGGDLPGCDPEKRRWLQDEVGLAIWGTPASLDWSPWYRFYADAAGTPLHICTGWDWPVRLPHSLGKEAWFPARFHPANIEAWQGHHVTPYMNDLFISAQAEGFQERWEPNLVYPYVIFPFTRFSERDPEVVATGRPGSDARVTTDVPFWTCPATEAQAELHSWRDLTLVRDYNMAGVCYDISSGNPWFPSRCLRWEHGHPPGRGRHMVEAFDRVNRLSKKAVRDETGRYLVQGVETIIENVIGSVDFYVARAGAGPLGGLEAWVPAPEEPPGIGRELLPLFDAVYHDIGPVRHDGWLNLSNEIGDLFYWAAARIALQWGGLLSLQYANSPPERLDEAEVPAQLINWDGSTVTFDELPEPDFEKIAFVGQLARIRTEVANRFLSHGRMLRPLPIEVENVTLGFQRRFNAVPGQRIEGAWEVPSVVHGAWQAPDGTLGLLLVAVGDNPASLQVTADPKELWGLDLRGATVEVKTVDGVLRTITIGEDGRLEINFELASRLVHLVEVTTHR